MVSEIPGEGLEELASRIASFARKLKGIDVDNVLEAQILGHLLVGGRTIPELVHIIYQVQYEDAEYSSNYMKIRRTVQNLSSKGYVSCPLFGTNRLHRLTEHAIAKLTNIGGEAGERRIALLSRSQITLYAVTTILGGISLAVGIDAALEAWAYVVFAFLLGLSVASMARAVRRVL